MILFIFLLELLIIGAFIVIILGTLTLIIDFGGQFILLLLLQLPLFMAICSALVSTIKKLLYK